MISLWSAADETTRVVAFLCINRQVRISQQAMLEPCIKVSLNRVDTTHQVGGFFNK